MLVLVLGLVVGLVVTDVNAQTGASVPPVMVMSDLEMDLTATEVDTRPATVLPAGHDEEDDTSASSSWNVSRFHRGGVRRSRSRTRRRKKATTSRLIVSEGVPATIAPASTETAAESEVAAREMLRGVPGAVGTLPTPAVDAYNTPEAPTPVRTEPSVPAVVLAAAPTPAPVAPEVPKPAIVPTEAPTPAPIPAPTPALVPPKASMPAPIPAEAPLPAPIPGEVPAPIPPEAVIPAIVPADLPAPAPIPDEPPTPAPVPGDPPAPAPVPAPVLADAPTPAPIPGGPPTPAPVPGDPPRPALVPGEPPTPAPVPTEALTPGPTLASAALTPTPVPVPVDADVPLPPYNTTPEALPIVPAIATPTTAATTLPTDLPLEDNPSPINGSSSSNTPNSTTDSFDSDSDSTSASTHYEDATQDLVDESSDRTPDDSSSTPLVLTFAPIIADHTATDSSGDPELNHDVHHSNASTTSGRPRPLGGWKLALVVIGAICVVIVSIILVHMRHVRVVAANKRHRGSSQQRALESFFRQNRVTVGRETGISSGVFVTDPLTPRDEIAVTMPMDARFQTQTVDFTAAAAPAYIRRPCTPGVLDTPTDSHQGQEFDSFTGPAPLALSSSSSSLYWSNSVSSDANSSASRRSLDLSSQLLPPIPAAIRDTRTSSVTFNTDVMRDTNRSEQSRSGFSVRFTMSTSSDDVNWTSTS
uniref:RxLR effector candidate protein n=1 Tax=Hyaloperonospora arabidopsidis (strain Emoy2) TaxID=559515 RepID=M4BCH2_HYAAE